MTPRRGCQTTFGTSELLYRLRIPKVWRPLPDAEPSAA